MTSLSASRTVALSVSSSATARSAGAQLSPATQSAYLGNSLRRASANQTKATKPAVVAKLIKCQAFQYGLDPSMAKFDYQPMELPTAPVQTYDFLVLGSGIAGLTYALKVSASSCAGLHG